MLSVRVTAPSALAAEVRARLETDATVCNLASVPGAALGGEGDLLLFEMARENANNVIRMLRHAGIPAQGGIVVTDPVVVLSDAAIAAERAAPGHPADGMMWAQLADRSQEDARPSWSFFVFLLLATLIAGVGRLLDQPILIIGAMVVGPEFAPIAAICYAVVRRKPAVIGSAMRTLWAGFGISAAASVVIWTVLALSGAISYEQATTGTLTQFIVKPDIWSFVIALLAGVAGVLSLSSSKSSALVGVFISITTVPAVGTFALTLAVGAWNEAFWAVIQLLVNVAGIIVAGILTLYIQLRIGRRGGRGRVAG
jgi:uncharacterized hydrophobic protein (TIGR00271 family)